MILFLTLRVVSLPEGWKPSTKKEKKRKLILTCPFRLQSVILTILLRPVGRKTSVVMSHSGLPNALAEDLVTFDQFILLGDSITQNASNQESGFGFVPALAHGMLCFAQMYSCLFNQREDYARRLDVINRGFRLEPNAKR